MKIYFERLTPNWN